VALAVFFPKKARHSAALIPSKAHASPTSALFVVRGLVQAYRTTSQTSGVIRLYPGTGGLIMGVLFATKASIQVW